MGRGCGRARRSTLADDDLAELRGINERLDLDEVADDLPAALAPAEPLCRRDARTCTRSTDTFLGDARAPVPYIIGLAGSVAVGKSTTARILQALLAPLARPSRASTSSPPTASCSRTPCSTSAGLMDRKGFPESYDIRRARRASSPR